MSVSLKHIFSGIKTVKPPPIMIKYTSGKIIKGEEDHVMTFLEEMNKFYNDSDEREKNINTFIS